MKPEIAAQWCEALRSGKYKQGKEYLRKGNSFCCLGVLCDLSGIGKWREGHNRHGYLVDGAESTLSLPLKVKEWADIKYHEGWMEGVEESLSSLNDDGKTFAEIADIIERNVEAL